MKTAPKEDAAIEIQGAEIKRLQRYA